MRVERRRAKRVERFANKYVIFCNYPSMLGKRNFRCVLLVVKQVAFEIRDFKDFLRIDIFRGLEWNNNFNLKQITQSAWQEN